MNFLTLKQNLIEGNIDYVYKKLKDYFKLNPNSKVIDEFEVVESEYLDFLGSKESSKSDITRRFLEIIEELEDLSVESTIVFEANNLIISKNRSSNFLYRLMGIVVFCSSLIGIHFYCESNIAGYQNGDKYLSSSCQGELSHIESELNIISDELEKVDSIFDNINGSYSLEDEERVPSLEGERRIPIIIQFDSRHNLPKKVTLFVSSLDEKQYKYEKIIEVELGSGYLVLILSFTDWNNIVKNKGRLANYGVYDAREIKNTPSKCEKISDENLCNIRKELNALVVGETTDLLKRSLELLSDNSKKKKELRFLSNRYSEAKKFYMHGLITFAEYRIESGKTVSRMIEIIDDLKNNDINREKCSLQKYFSRLN